MSKSGSLDVTKLVEEERGLFTWLTEAAAAFPDRLVARGKEGDQTVNVTLAELEAKCRRLAAGLQSKGFGVGDTLAAWIPNRMEWLTVQFACAALGVAVLGLNTRYRSNEVGDLLRTVPVRAIVLPSTFLNIDFLGTIDAALDEVRQSDPSFECPELIFIGDVPEGSSRTSPASYSFADLMASEALTAFDDHGKSLSNLFTTSGSTSAPKVAGHDQTSILRHSAGAAVALDVVADDKILAVLPLCGVFGFSAAMALVIGGGAIVMVEVFDGAQGARDLAENGVTHMVGGDEMLKAVFNHVPEGHSLPNFRRGGIANFAGRAKDVVAEAEERWGTKLSGVYGSSELFALSALWPADEEAALRGLGGGLVVDDGIQVRVCDVESDQPVVDGEPGELQFRGYNVIEGYLNNARANKVSFSNDGWFKSGDLGYLGHGGFVYQCRAREALRLRGFLVEPGEIEDFIATEPSVEEVHVVGVDTDHGVKAFAFARSRPGETIDEARLLARARQQIATYKIPDRVIQVDDFPTTTGTNGTKIRFDELRALALTHLAAASEA